MIEPQTLDVRRIGPDGQNEARRSRTMQVRSQIEDAAN
jgi:hypothetical protein